MLLMTPGPSRVPETVLKAGAQPMMHHRTPEFSNVLVSVVKGLRPLYGTEGTALPVHTTGRGAMEASICNLFSPGDELIACCNGKFGDMWAGYAESYGVTVHRICTDWSQEVDPDEVEATVLRHPKARAVTLAHCDSSTGTLSHVEEVCRITRSQGVLSMVDCVCALGGIPFQFDDWGVDIAITSSQKCLMASPGLAFVMLSERAWEATKTSKLPCNYWDFAAIRESLSKAKPETPGTTPVHLVLQVHEALRLMLEETLPQVYARHEQMSGMVQDFIPELGLSLQCPDLSRQAPTLTAIKAPAGIAPQAIRKAMRERGILIAAGLGPFSETAFRIGHLGDIRPADVRFTLDALKEVLAELQSGT